MSAVRHESHEEADNDTAAAAGGETAESGPLYKPAPGEQPAKGFTWNDYEGVDADAEGEGEHSADDGWTTVPSRSRPASAAGAAKAGSGAEDAEPTKKQRQHAAKRDALKAAKEDAERDRLARLAKHKRELERVRSEQMI